MDVALWTYPDGLTDVANIEGFDVEAQDGSIGEIDQATHEVGAAYVVVDTGPWIFGRKVLVPASTIKSIDLDNRKAFVGLTKDQIKASPELGVDAAIDQTYRDEADGYYGSLT
jgi:hypothetical protein